MRPLWETALASNKLAFARALIGTICPVVVRFRRLTPAASKAVAMTQTAIAA